MTAEVFNFASPLSDVPDLTGLTPDMVTTISALNLRNPGLVFGANPFGFGSSPGRAIRYTAVLHTDPGYHDFKVGVPHGAILWINGYPYLTVSDNGAFQEVTVPTLCSATDGC